jgi:hypothetical protein
MGKISKSPYKPPTEWDKGTQTIAAVGGEFLIREFREYLEGIPREQRSPRMLYAGKKRDPVRETEEQVLRRLARAFLGAARKVVLEDAAEIDPKTGKPVNPNNVKRLRRVDMLEIYFRRGWITRRGFTAAEALRDAWEATGKMKGMSWAQDRVDSTPKPDAAIDIQIDRVSRLAVYSRHISAPDVEIIRVVVYDGNAIGSLKQYRGRAHEAGKEHLRAALDRLADALDSH